MSWFSNLQTEYKNYKLFFSKEYREHRRLVFYSERDIYFQTFAPFIREILQDPDVSCSYITSDPNDPLLLQHHERLQPFYFNHFLKSVFDKMDAQIFVFTMPDLNTYHLKKSPHTQEYVYLFHAFSSTHLQYNERAFDAYDTIFCVGPHHVQEIQKRENLYHLPNKKLLPIGYPRMDVVYQTFQQRPCKHDKEVKKILIAPTWSVSSLFENGIEELIEVLAPLNYAVVLRPHPEFLKRCPRQVSHLQRKIASLANFIWEDRLLSEENLYDADVLITDRSGIAFEYAFGTERPVIFIETPLKKHNPRWQDLQIEPIEIALRKEIGIEVPLTQCSTLPSLLDNLLMRREEWRQRLCTLREQHVFHWNQSAYQGATYILNQLKKTLQNL
ncbi:MAG: CDP-glycerol glycerophosphotransferase family protein [Puniceicoccales bacterium]|jgi:YidC/Oxa1 family membrane protein insertase|nr:CDP-glycerol glycerophosphotransferase family protein [Puniceicoccales bacterium]